MIHHHPRNLCFKFHINRSNRLATRRDYVYYNGLYKLNNKVTISSHLFINIFQLVHFYLLIPKSQKVGKNLKQWDRAQLHSVVVIYHWYRLVFSLHTKMMHKMKTSHLMMIRHAQMLLLNVFSSLWLFRIISQ